MTTIRASATGDTWLTAGDTELLHVLADALPPEVRHHLAETLRKAGAPLHTGQPTPMPATEDPPLADDLAEDRGAIGTAAGLPVDPPG